MGYVYSILASLFASITIILSKKSISDISINLVVFIRSLVVVLISFFILIFTNSFHLVFNIKFSSLLFLILSGISTSICYYFYFKALEHSSIISVSSVDKLSIIFTCILSFFIFNNSFNYFSFIFIIIGIILMIDSYSKYLWYAVISALFASLMAILAKFGLTGLNTNVGTFIRSITVLLCYIFTIRMCDIKKLNVKKFVVVFLSGISLSVSWLLYYLSIGMIPINLVVFIDRIGIIFTIIMSYLFYKEKVSLKNIGGLILIIIGGLLLLF